MEPNNKKALFFKNNLFLKNTGFTIIEVLVASIILGIVISGVMLLYTRGHTLAVKQKRQRAAMAMAERIMENNFSRVSLASFNMWDSACAESCYMKNDGSICLPCTLFSLDSIDKDNAASIIDTAFVVLKPETLVIDDGSGTPITIPQFKVAVNVRWTDYRGSSYNNRLERIVTKP
ncbi:MAG: type II secretion system protein [bacterium]